MAGFTLSIVCSRSFKPSTIVRKNDDEALCSVVSKPCEQRADRACDCDE
jgi:hypothetical protein